MKRYEWLDHPTSSAWTEEKLKKYLRTQSNNPIIKFQKGGGFTILSIKGILDSGGIFDINSSGIGERDWKTQWRELASERGVKKNEYQGELAISDSHEQAFKLNQGLNSETFNPGKFFGCFWNCGLESPEKFLLFK